MPRKPATVTFPLPVLTDEQTTIIADAIASTCATLPPATVEKHRNFYFKQLINSEVIIKGERIKVVQAFQEDDAKKVVGFALSRLEAGSILKNVPTIGMEVV